MSRATLEKHIEKAAVDLLKEMGWSAANVENEILGERGTLGREHRGVVVLERKLRPALRKLNPDLPKEAIDQAVEEITRDRSAMSLVQANREVYRLIKDGVRVRAAGGDDAGESEGERRVRVIDWEHPEKNDFFVAQQFWVQGEMYLRRADLVGFVNGLPLVFIELKGIRGQKIEDAYRDNFRDYLSAIPQLFWFNAVVLLSTGLENRVGSITGAWDHFKEWKRVEREDEPRSASLEVLLRGICDKARLLDLVESFTLFSEQRSDVAKIIGQNHQFLGVNGAISAVQQLVAAPRGAKNAARERRRLGVFWHTQGSGKSFSMVFFSQKILRKMPGNWTFVILTDREDLDAQIYKTFVGCGAVPPPGKSKKDEREHGVQAKSGEHLQQLLREDHRYVFTLIQKFRTEVKGAKYPMLSERSDIIVIADEAHRTQYDTFAMNLRNALPNAAFIGFTGTPLMAGEEKTREVFGDYVSVYNFREAVEDNATVPLYYEARIPQLQLTNEQLADDLADLLEEAELDEEQQKKVEREFSRQYQLITREDRLDTIAEDLVTHFLGLPRHTKAMVVAIDKVTAVRMHDKVKAAWANKKAELEAKLAHTPRDEKAHEEIRATVAFMGETAMGETAMAVVVSPSQNEVETFKKKGLDITPHRQRMLKEDLDTRFKDDQDRLRIVFVCAMWMTGFDVPSCGVIYLDKPMRNHTLMQTIARANRVYEGKESGLIVDYVGVFRNLQNALAIYGAGSGGRVRPGDSPVQPKEVQLAELRGVIAEARGFCAERGVDLDGVKTSKVLDRLARLKDEREKLVHPAEVKKTFLDLADRVDRLYRALGVDERKDELAGDWGVLTDLAGAIRALERPVDISKVMEAVERLLDDSIAARPLKIRETTQPFADRIHLGGIDFDALARHFAKAKHKATLVEALITSAKQRVDILVRLNPTRGRLRDQLELLITEYNAGARNAAQFFPDLLEFLKEMAEEEGRAGEEALSGEELAFHDLLLAPQVKLSAKEREAVKRIARELPKKLAKKLVIDWRKTERARSAVRTTLKDVLDDLPEAYDETAFEQVLAAVYEHVYESYWGEGKSKYTEAGAS